MARSDAPPGGALRGAAGRLVFEREVEVVAVGVDADHLVGERFCGDCVQEDPGAAALYDLVAVRRLGGVVDRELHLAVDLLAADPDRAHARQCLHRVFVDLQHRASLCVVRILIAEDETIIRLDLRDLLERAGHEVVAEARDGAGGRRARPAPRA